MARHPLRISVIAAAFAATLSSSALATELQTDERSAAAQSPEDESAGPPPAEIYTPEALDGTAAAAKVNAERLADSNVMNRPLGETIRSRNSTPELDANGMPLGEPVIRSGFDLPEPTPQQIREQAQRGRADAIRMAEMAAAVGVILGIASLAFYRAQPRKGPRRLAVVGSGMASLATAIAMVVSTGEPTPELALAIAAFTLATGLAVLVLSLLGLSAWRWVGAGFGDDRASKTSDPHAIPTATPGDA